MESLQVSLFHRFQIHLSNERIELEVRKVQELFCFLILFHAKAHHRETLADRLWSETPASQSRRLLRKTLWQLQSALSQQKGVLRVEPEWIQLAPQANLWVDVLAFEQAYNSVHGIAGRQLTQAQAQALGKAADLYVGDLLEGWYCDWCVYERQRYQFMHLAMLDKLAAYGEAHEKFESGIGYATRILSHDNTREHTHRQLMTLYYLGGDRIAALQQYERCRLALKEEIGVEPDERTVDLFQQIRANKLPRPDRLPISPETPSAAQVHSILERLHHLQTTLDKLREAVDEEIHTIHQVIDRLVEPDGTDPRGK